jgi:hypothetical protein
MAYTASFLREKRLFTTELKNESKSLKSAVEQGQL